MLKRRDAEDKASSDDAADDRRQPRKFSFLLFRTIDSVTSLMFRDDDFIFGFTFVFPIVFHVLHAPIVIITFDAYIINKECGINMKRLWEIVKETG